MKLITKGIVISMIIARIMLG